MLGKHVKKFEVLMQPVRIRRVVFLSIIFVIVFFIYLGHQIAGSNYVKVTIPFKGKIQDYKFVLVEGKYTSPPKYGGDEFYIENSVINWLEKNGMEGNDRTINLNQKIADLVINVEIKQEYGIPYSGRHFSINFIHQGDIKIQFFDNKLNSVVGEAYYHRPFFKYTNFDIIKIILDMIVQYQYGLTEFSRWEQKNFEKSKISIELPSKFFGFRDREVEKETEWYKNILTLYFHKRKIKDRISYGLDIYFEEMEPNYYFNNQSDSKNSSKKDIVYDSRGPHYFHTKVEKHDLYPGSGPWLYYIKDYKNDRGRIVRGMAVLNIKLRPEGPLIDEQAISHILNSVEIQGFSQIIQKNN
jgi:hypothetical protein